MEYVYLLWSHGEDGPTDLVATLDRSRIVELARACDTNGWFQRVKREGERGPIEVLEQLLTKTDDHLLFAEDAPHVVRAAASDGIYSLMGGWGGLHFQVVKLF